LQHCRSLIIASLALVPNYRQFKQFQFSVHTTFTLPSIMATAVY
jgi:hypothetical protein